MARAKDSTTPAQHTPGPWTYSDDDGICMLITSPKGHTLAEVGRVACGNASGANARLIAAAPKMRAALLDAVASLDYAVKALGAPEKSAMRENLADLRAILRDMDGQS